MEQYDYWKRRIDTHSDEECKDIMEEILRLFYNPDGNILLEEGKIPTGHISEREYDLLMEYAPKLFDTLPLDKDLYDTMYEFVGRKVDVYCNNLLFREYYDKNFETKHLYRNKSLEYKADKVRESIDNIIGLIPCIQEDLHDTLAYLRKNAEEAVYHRPNSVISLSLTTDPVRKYLKSLELPYKTKEIDNFVQKLKRNISE